MATNAQSKRSSGGSSLRVASGSGEGSKAERQTEGSPCARTGGTSGSWSWGPVESEERSVPLSDIGLSSRRPGSLGFGAGCGGGRLFEMGMGALLQSCRRAPAPVVGARRAFS